MKCNPLESRVDLCHDVFPQGFYEKVRKPHAINAKSSTAPAIWSCYSFSSAAFGGRVFLVPNLRLGAL